MIRSKNERKRARTVYNRWVVWNVTKFRYYKYVLDAHNLLTTKSWLLFDEATGLIGCELCKRLLIPKHKYKGSRKSGFGECKVSTENFTGNDINRHIITQIHRYALLHRWLWGEGTKVIAAVRVGGGSIQPINDSEREIYDADIEGGSRPRPTAHLFDRVHHGASIRGETWSSPQKKHQNDPGSLNWDEYLELYLGNLRLMVKVIFCLGSNADFKRDVQ